MIWANASAAPDKLILKDLNRTWSWRQLLQRAHAYAKLVSASGVPPQIIVPVIVGRAIESIAAMLGCVVANRAFAPVSIDQPEQRLTSCLTQLGCPFVFADKLTGRLELDSIAGFQVLRPHDVVANDELPSVPSCSDEDLLYVLFTSGSTGQPKGVLVDHGNIVNTILWGRDILDWRSDDVIGIAVNLYFDIAMFDIFTGLCLDVPIAVLSKPNDGHAVCNEIAIHKISSIFAAPMFFSQFVRYGLLRNGGIQTLRRIISGGDFFPPSHILQWLEHRPGTDIYNVWGPTETSVVNTMHLIGESDLPSLRAGIAAPVGRSHPRMPFVLLDEKLERVEGPGQQGEICMQGPCVTKGYLKDEQRTAAAYIEFGGLRTYRTGDIGSVDTAGNLHIHGRMGNLIKVAGHRIDVGEVEGAATRDQSVHAAATFVHEPGDGIQELCLAVELTGGDNQFDTFIFKKRLREILPSYMVPKRIVVMSKLPTTPNQKIDRRAIAAAFKTTQ
jgi:amino acid adenylation domain-containing protein